MDIWASLDNLVANIRQFAAVELFVPEAQELFSVTSSSDEILSVTNEDRIENLNRNDVEEIIRIRGSLRGKTLVPGIVISDLKFSGVEVDRPILQMLIDQHADVTGVDISNQNLKGMNLSAVNLSRAKCGGTIFSKANVKKTNFTDAIFTRYTHFDHLTLDETNLTGVNLDDVSLLNTHIISVIVGDSDRQPYVACYLSRLFFIFSGVKNTNGIDPFYELTDQARKKFLRDLLFPLTDFSLMEGKTSIDNGPQDIVVDDEFDRRIIKKNKVGARIENTNLIDIDDYVNAAKQKLLEEGFSKAQKTLFHHARSVVDGVLKFNGLMYAEDLITQVEFERNKLLSQMYIERGLGEPRVVSLLMEGCFQAVAPNFFDSLTGKEIEAVYALFNSENYCWP